MSVYVDVYKAAAKENFRGINGAWKQKYAQHGYQDIKVLLNGTKKGCADLWYVQG
jgi:hypothetical protein